MLCSFPAIKRPPVSAGADVGMQLGERWVSEIDADGCDVHNDDLPNETAKLCYSAADHLINAALLTLIGIHHGSLT